MSAPTRGPAGSPVAETSGGCLRLLGRAVERATVAAALAFALLAGVAPGPAGAAPPGIHDIGPVEPAPRDSGLPPDWDRRAVFAEIFVRAYQDSNGDGIGDLNGVTQRLDYLKQLGIGGIWLMPVFKSDDHDHGYAVVDYRDIEPDYGTLADLDRLVAEAHKRGIGVIIDYVINHSSSAHPLFQEARDQPNAPHGDWYLFSDKPMTGWTAFDGNPWHPAGSRWYYGAFWSEMPDFNLRNPAVVDFHLNNLRFWLNRGVDGFRFDAVGVLFENGSIGWENQPENHVLMKRVQGLLAQYGKRTMVCEAPSDPAPFAAADSCGSAFAFGLQKHLTRSVKLGRVVPELLNILRTLPVERMGTFLSNHDYFAGARPFQQFQGDEGAYRVAAAALLTLPGHPFLYYGEEIGLAHAEGVSGSDPALRGPMSWSGEAQAGFTTAAKPFRPNVSNWRTHNVAAEEANPKSLLHWYRGLIALRTSQPSLATGSFSVLSKSDDPVFAFVREQDGRRVMVAINLAARDVGFALPADFQAAAWKPVFPAGATLVVGPPEPPPAAKPAPAAKGRKPPAATPAAAPAAAAPAGLELTLGPQQVLVIEAAP